MIDKITVYDWMINDLKLKGNCILVYAIIFGETCRKGWLKCYISLFSKWCNSTRMGVTKNLNFLLSKNLIEKEIWSFGGGKSCKYRVNFKMIDREILKKYVKIKNIEIPKIKNSKLKEDFETLWSFYPRKQGKIPAFDKYTRVIKNGDASYDQIEEGILNYAQYVKDKDPKYIMMGSTFFNQERWNDDWRIIHKPSITERYAQKIRLAKLEEQMSNIN